MDERISTGARSNSLAPRELCLLCPESSSRASGNVGPGSLRETSHASLASKRTHHDACFSAYDRALWKQKPVFHSADVPLQTEAGNYAPRLSDSCAQPNYGLPICRLDEPLWF